MPGGKHTFVKKNESMKRIIIIFYVFQVFCFSKLFGQYEIKSLKQQNLKPVVKIKSLYKPVETKIIQGKIIDETGEPIIGANISISGTTIGTISDFNGNFLLKVPVNTKLIKISFTGYYTSEVIPVNNLIIKLYPKVSEIKEVSVVAKKPTIEVTAKKTTIFPELLPTTSSGTAYSVLKNLPGIIINSNGSIYLNGKAGVKMLVDGKDSYLNGTDLLNYLMSLPASSLKKIDLINHPSAKYEASGNAGIIDICTKKSNTAGYNFNVNTTYEQGKYRRSNNNMTMGFRQNRLNMNVTYGYNKGNDYVDLTVSRDFPGKEDEPMIFFDQDSYRKRNDKTHYLNFGLDFYANAKTTLGMTVRGNSSDRIENGTLNSNFYTLTTQSDSTIQSVTDNDEKRKNITSSVYFQYKLDSLGKEISASANSLFYSIDERQFHHDLLSRSSVLSSESISQAQKDGTIKMYSVRVDAVYPIREKLSFDAGVKSDIVNIDNTSNNEKNINDLWINDEILTSKFYYKEIINALYISSKLKHESFIAEVGFRIENTNVKGDSLNQSYTNFFPNIMLIWKLSNSSGLNLSYSRRIDRPNYRYLNPFVYVFDSYTYEKGNTDLKPQFTDRYYLSYTIRRAYKISLFYTNTQQAIIKSYFVQSGTKRVLVMPTNMSSYQSYGVQCDIALINITRWFQSSVHSEVGQNKYIWTENGERHKNENWTYQIGLQNRIKLLWGLSGEISGFYNSRMAYGQIDVLPLWQISGGIQKNFFDKKATLNIFSNDWFHANKTRVDGIICDGHAATTDLTDHTIIGISFTYRLKKGSDVKKNNNKKNIDTKRISL